MVAGVGVTVLATGWLVAEVKARLPLVPAGTVRL
jgi:hypothetical protein